MWGAGAARRQWLKPGSTVGIIIVQAMMTFSSTLSKIRWNYSILQLTITPDLLNWDEVNYLESQKINLKYHGNASKDFRIAQKRIQWEKMQQWHWKGGDTEEGTWYRWEKLKNANLFYMVFYWKHNLVVSARPQGLVLGSWKIIKCCDARNMNW